MLFTLIVAIAAGAMVPYLEPRIRELMGRVFDEAQMPDAAGVRMATFGVALLAAAILLSLAGTDDAPVLMVLGGLVGAFQAEIRAAIQARR